MSGRMIFQSIDIAYKFSYVGRPYDSDARSKDAGLQPFLDEPDDALVADPVLQEADNPLLGNLREERPDVGVEYVVHLSAADPDDQRIQRIMLAAPRPEPVRASRPAGSHRQPLSEPSVRLSPHWAPIRQTCRSYQFASARRDSRDPEPAVAETGSREPYRP